MLKHIKTGLVLDHAALRMLEYQGHLGITEYLFETRQPTFPMPPLDFRIQALTDLEEFTRHGGGFHFRPGLEQDTLTVCEQALARGTRRLHGLLGQRQARQHPVVKNLQEKVFFVFEVLIKQRAGNPRALRDIAEGTAGKTEIQKTPARRIQYLGAPRVHGF